MKRILFVIAVIIPLILNAQSSWKFVEETSLVGTISGTISNGYVFKTIGGAYYIVNDFSLQIVVTVAPDVTIFKKETDYKLIIGDFDEPVICKKLTEIVETQIDGEFEGWEGETIFKMFNGQIWQQISAEYYYHYAYMPHVLIYKYGKAWHMKVEDVDETIQVIQLQ